jgi:hypothetical protein
MAFNFIVVIGMTDIPKTLRFLTHIPKLDILTTPLGHIFSATAMQNKHEKEGGEQEPRH